MIFFLFFKSMSTEVVNKIIKRMLIAIKHNDIKTKGKKFELRKNARKELITSNDTLYKDLTHTLL